MIAARLLSPTFRAAVMNSRNLYHFRRIGDAALWISPANMDLASRIWIWRKMNPNDA
jgi:hypothetical protein